MQIRENYTWEKTKAYSNYFFFISMHNNLNNTSSYLQWTTTGLFISALLLTFPLKSKIELTVLGTPLSGHAVK